MKKVLLTTTALVMTAGVAAAEVSISGTAGVAAVKDQRMQSARMTSGVDLNFAVSAAADNGLTMAATVDLGEGELIDYNDDFAVGHSVQKHVLTHATNSIGCHNRHIQSAL